MTAKLRGRYPYYGITGNTASLRRFRSHVTQLWYKWFCHRSNKVRIPWERFGALAHWYPLPPARLIRPRLTT